MFEYKLNSILFASYKSTLLAFVLTLDITQLLCTIFINNWDCKVTDYISKGILIVRNRVKYSSEVLISFCVEQLKRYLLWRSWIESDSCIFIAIKHCSIVRNYCGVPWADLLEWSWIENQFRFSGNVFFGECGR